MRGPSIVQTGGTVVVEVGPNDTEVTVSSGGPDSTTHPVQGGKSVSFPVPPVPPGTVLIVSVGSGVRARSILIEVVEAD
ncbi:MAG: hypothetical protein AB7O97_04245 [Planctomycetota bacterium]